MKTKILYVYGYGDLPDSDIVKKLQENLDSTKYEVISDYYAQYKPSEALTDINNYIKKHKIGFLIGENIGGYLISLLDNDLPKVLINPMFDPAVELEEYETTQIDDKGNEVTLKLVPPHIIKFYKESIFKPIYNDNIFCMFSNDDNYEDYAKVTNHVDKYDDPIKTIIDMLNNVE